MRFCGVEEECESTMHRRADSRKPFMLRTRWPILVAALFLGVPALAMAQQGEEDSPEVVDESEGIDDREVSEESAESEEGEVEEQAAAVEVGDDGEVIQGPGGRPLRTDYPGTEESLQPRMDTRQIEGVERLEGEDAEEVYDLRVRELETQIDDLKERVFRSKSRIVLLKETVLAENLAGSRAVVTFENALGTAYQVERGIFSIDGSRVYSAADTQELRAREGLEVFSGPLAPGTHTVSVSLGLRGSGYGLFSYARGYEFDLRFSCQFTAEEGRTTRVIVRSYKGGNVFTAHEDRPDGICHVTMTELTVDELEPADPPDRD
jgi:hypothetical protein